MRILGIDPGSRVTGYGVMEEGGKQYIASGCIRAGHATLSQRLLTIQDSLKALLDQYQPTIAAIESVFVHHNPSSALKLGQARGVCLVVLSQYGLPIYEYAPRLIKQTLAGTGSASKGQVQQMVMRELHLQEAPQEDASDALAIALTHAHLYKSPLMKEASPI